MSNKDFIDIFNSNVVDFLTQLTIYDNIVNFTLYKNSVIASILIDKFSIRNMFDKTVAVHYSSQILQKDDKFFLDQSYDEYNLNDFSIINSIKKVWLTIDDTSKSKIWDYLNVLIYLNKKII